VTGGHRALPCALALPLSLSQFLALVTACSSNSGGACDCADPAITITIPTDIAPSTSAPMLSGTACANVQATCTKQAGGCSEYQFDANATGTCHVIVPVGDTTYTADITFIAATGCCTGYVASPASAANIDVPEPVASEDGGVG
jgi:hypothetical protein